MSLKSISSILSFDKKVSKVTSERSALIEQFVTKINIERIDTQFKPVLGRVIAVKTSHMSLKDLYYFWSVCLKSKSFGRTFFGSLKVKINNKKVNET